MRCGSTLFAVSAPTRRRWRVDGLYSALQQGVVDGQEQPIANYYAGKYMEVQKYFAITNHMYGPAFFIVGAKWLQGLPADLKEIVV